MLISSAFLSRGARVRRVPWGRLPGFWPSR
jgi:hypothetical protein